MPWEQDERPLTESEVKQQLARMLATGALQVARKQPRRQPTAIKAQEEEIPA